MGSKQVVSGVTVTWQDAKHPKLDASDGPRSKLAALQSSKDDEFKPSRIVTNLKLHLGDASVAEVDLDDVHVQIAYTAAQGVTPVAGWWDGRKWVTFKNVSIANNIIDVILPSPWPTDPAIGVYP